MTRALLFLLLCCFPLSHSAAQATTERDSRMILVARDVVEDEGLRKQLAQVGGAEAKRFTLALSAAPSIGEALPGVDACIARKSFSAANDRELARRISEADVLIVRGGTFMGWYDTVFHEQGPTLLFKALLDFVRQRKTVIAHGGAAAFFCAGTTIPRSELDETPRNPRYEHSQVARTAMRLGPPALLDSDDWPEGSPLRWFHSLWQTRMKVGFYLVGEVALDHRRDTSEMRVLGPGSVVVCDASSVRAMKRRFEGLRLSLLYAGDGWSFDHNMALLAPKLEPAELMYFALSRSDKILYEAPLLAGTALHAALHKIALQGGGSARPPSDPPQAWMLLHCDSITEAWSRGEERPTTLLSVPARLEWKTELFLPSEKATPPR